MVCLCKCVCGGGGGMGPGGTLEYFKSNAAGIEYGEEYIYKEYFEKRTRSKI